MCTGRCVACACACKVRLFNYFLVMGIRAESRWKVEVAVCWYARERFVLLAYLDFLVRLLRLRDFGLELGEILGMRAAVSVRRFCGCF